MRNEAPTPEQVKEARLRAGLSQAQAAEMVHSLTRSWQRWESGARGMHPAFWELFQIKARELFTIKTK